MIKKQRGNILRVSVIGLGYIGLPTAALIASENIKVLGIDINPEIIDTVTKGETGIVEPGLEKLVSSVVQSKFLTASMKLESSDVFLITVPTPITKDYLPNINHVEAAVESIAPHLKIGNLVILESTSPVGTTEKMVELFKKLRPDLDFPDFYNKSEIPDINIVYSPERVLPGNILQELRANDRIIGGVSNTCSQEGSDFYKRFVDGDCLITDVRTAELCKLTENSFRDVNIAFANELSIIADENEINIWELIKLANLHPRVNILQPGPGVGGHCIAVDPWFIVNSNPNSSKIIRQAREINDFKPRFILDKVHKLLNVIEKPINEIIITCLGLSFKPNIDDLRESPSLYIAQELSNLNIKKLNIVEPNITTLPGGFSRVAYLNDLNESIDSSDLIILLVDHNEFKTLNQSIFEEKLLLDTRGIWSL